MSDALQSAIVDTNVWLDIFLPNRPGRPGSMAFFKVAIRKDVNLLFAPQTLCDQSVPAYQGVTSFDGLVAHEK